MRIVAVADTHTFHDDLGSIPEGDVFLHAGDLLNSGRMSELEPVAEWIRSLSHPHKLVIAGNHDWCFAEEKRQAVARLGRKITYLEDSGIEIDGARFWGSPWQPEFCDWAFNLPRGAPLAAKWALIPEGTDVLMTHGPPRGFGDFNYGGKHVGCEDLLEAVKRVRPLLHVFGHIHEAGGVWQEDGVMIANVTAAEGRRGVSVFDLDPETRRVVAVSIPPR